MVGFAPDTDPTALFRLPASLQHPNGFDCYIFGGRLTIRSDSTFDLTEQTVILQGQDTIQASLHWNGSLTFLGRDSVEPGVGLVDMFALSNGPYLFTRTSDGTLRRPYYACGASVFRR